MSEDVGIHRKFVHDISNNLTIADCVVMKVLKQMGEKELQGSDDFIQLEKVQKHLKSVVHQIKEYRQELHYLAGENRA